MNVIAKEKQVRLPTGAIATVRMLTGKDLLDYRLRPELDSLFYLISVSTRIDGRQVEYEDLLSMHLGDVMALQKEVNRYLNAEAVPAAKEESTLKH